MKRAKWKHTLAAALLVCGGDFAARHNAAAAAQNATAATRAITPRAEAERAIRKAFYESFLAAITGDANAYKQHAAQRTLELYGLIYDELMKNAAAKAMYRAHDVNNADEFINATLRLGASRFSKVSRADLEDFARRNSAAAISFVNDKEAVITGPAHLRVVLERGAWKIDESEQLKKGFAQVEQLSAESQARILNF